MTRQELYDLVWSKPMTHIAKDFGMSDQGIRKHCVKNDIPTPPLGYWAKLAHGKKVVKPKLPTKKLAADVDVPLSPRAAKYRTESGDYDLKKLAGANAELVAACTVPEALPKSLPTMVRQVRFLLKRAKTNTHGLKEVGGYYSPDFLVGKESIDRACRILFTLHAVAASLSHRLIVEDEKLYWWVGEEQFLVRFKESTDKKPHEPTHADLKAQARREEFSWYSANRKAYPMWDYLPSGRLSVTLSDTLGRRWGRGSIEKRWRDTQARSLESRLPEVFLWLEDAVPLAKAKRLEAERQAQEEAERLLLQTRQRETRARADALEATINEMADIHDRLRKIVRLADYLDQGGGDVDPRFRMDVRAYTCELQRKIYGRVEEIVDDKEREDDSGLLIAALWERPAVPKYLWQY